MSPSASPRWRARQHMLVAAVLVATVGTVVLIGVNAVRLGEQTERIKAAQTQSTNLANATREALVLLQAVTELGERSDLQQIEVQRGLLARQIAVSIASFPAGAPEARELDEVRSALSRFPWTRLPQRHMHDHPLRLSAMALVGQSERRINALRSDEEKEYYSATIASLDANRRSQLGLAAAVGVIVALGVAGVTVALRRSRSDLAEAYVALQEEVGERRAAEAALRASEGRFRSLVQRASDLTIVTDEAGVVGYVSPAAEALLGYQPEDLVDRPLTDVVDPRQLADVGRELRLLAERPGLEHTIELRLRTRDGRVRLVEAVCQNLVGDVDVGGLVWNGRDVTDRRALEAELIRQAHHDPLTGLPNRMLLLERLERALRVEPASRGCVSVLVGDLDGFKNVNDTLGHPAGDELLRAAAQRLMGSVRDGDTVARLGGDEFAVLVAADNPGQAVAIGSRIVEVLHRPFTVAGTEVTVSASVGVAHQDGQSAAEDLLRDADIAMYVAKQTGKGRLEVFEPGMRARASYRTGLQQQLARAVGLGEIEVHYQPVVCLKTMRPTMLEALVRWRRPDGTLMPADVFVPLAEESGAIDEIGQEVLRQACRAVGRWRGLPGHAELGVAVNVSLQQVLAGRLPDQVHEALVGGGVPAAALVVEITESAPLEEPERVAAELVRLQRAGVRIAVDDFGAGYSSLGFLLDLDPDALKIDRTLLDFDTTRHGSLVRAIAELGHTLGLTVVAEGVETPQHLGRALEASCDAAQGFHFARPLPAQDVAGFLTRWANPAGRSVDVESA